MKTRVVQGFPTYRCNDAGQIINGRTGTVLKPFLTGSGIPTVRLWQKGAFYQQKVHLLILRTFVGDAKKGQVAMHLDADPTNNELENLRWGTRKENTRQMFMDENAHWQKLSAEQVREIRRRKEAGETYKELAEAFGMNSITSIYNICKRITWGWLL